MTGLTFNVHVSPLLRGNSFDSGVHNSIIALLFILLFGWAVISFSRIENALRTLHLLRRHDALQLEGMGSFSDDIQSLLRTHLDEILRLKANCPPLPITKFLASGWIDSSSFKMTLRGRSSTDFRSPTAYRFSFELDTAVPCTVQLIWGVPLSKLDMLLATARASKRGSLKLNNHSNYNWSLLRLLKREMLRVLGLPVSPPTESTDSDSTVYTPVNNTLGRFVAAIRQTFRWCHESSTTQQRPSTENVVDSHQMADVTRCLLETDEVELAAPNVIIVHNDINRCYLPTSFGTAMSTDYVIQESNVDLFSTDSLSSHCIARSPKFAYGVGLKQECSIDSLEMSSRSPLWPLFSSKMPSNSVTGMTLVSDQQQQPMSTVPTYLPPLLLRLLTERRNTEANPLHKSDGLSTNADITTGSDTVTVSSHPMSVTPQDMSSTATVDLQSEMLSHNMIPISNALMSAPIATVHSTDQLNNNIIPLIIVVERQRDVCPMTASSSAVTIDQNINRRRKRPIVDDIKPQASLDDNIRPTRKLDPLILADRHLTLVGFNGTMPTVIKQMLVCPSYGPQEIIEIFGMEDENERECLVCMTRVKDTLLLPCRHCSTCHKCLRSLRQERCPICRCGFTSYITFPFKCHLANSSNAPRSSSLASNTPAAVS